MSVAWEGYSEWLTTWDKHLVLTNLFEITAAIRQLFVKNSTWYWGPDQQKPLPIRKMGESEALRVRARPTIFLFLSIALCNAHS